MKKFYFKMQKCAYWSIWGDWSECTVTCGGGVQVHSRICIHGEEGDEGCEGIRVGQEACNTQVLLITFILTE